MKYFELIAACLISGSLGFYIASDGAGTSGGEKPSSEAVQKTKLITKKEVVYRTIPQLQNRKLSYQDVSEALFELDEQADLKDSEDLSFALLQVSGSLQSFEDHEFIDLFYALPSMQNLALQTNLEQRLFKAWGAKNYQAALSFLQDSYGDSVKAKNLEKLALTGLASRQPEQAYEWFLNKQEEQGEVGGWNGFLIDLFKHSSKSDLEASLDKVDTIEGTGNKLLALQGLLVNIDDSSHFPKLMEKYKSQEFQSFRNRAVRQWAKLSPLESLEWSRAHLEGSQQENATLMASKIWLKFDAELAANYLLEQSDDLDKSYRLIVQNWNRNSLDSLPLWLSKQDESKAKDSAYAELVNRFVAQDYKVAVNYAKLIQDEELRKQVNRRIYKVVQWQDKAAADSLFQ